MTAVVIVLAVFVGTFFLSVGENPEKDAVVSDVNIDIEGDSITIRHTGGDTLQSDNVELMIENNTADGAVMLGRVYPEEQFDAGDRFGTKSPLTGEVEVLVVHEPTNTIIASNEDRIERLNNAPPPTPDILSGTVKVNPRIPNAVVTAYDGETQLEQTQTNASGQYSMEFDDVGDVTHLLVNVEGDVDLDSKPLYAGATRDVGDEGTYNFTFDESANVTMTVDGSPISVIYGAQEGDAADNPITNVEMLQAMNASLDDPYELLRDIDASETGNWNNGFDPVGDRPKYGVPFTGSLDGNGHVIDGLTIDRPSENRVGLFGENKGVVRDVGLENVDISGKQLVGGLVGYNAPYGEVRRSYVTGTVDGSGEYTGGLVGDSSNLVSDSYANADVSGHRAVGGLVGASGGLSAEIRRSYAVGSVTGDIDVGGLVGDASSTDVIDSYWDTEEGPDSSPAGTGLTTSEMQGESNALDGFDAETWEFPAGEYPEPVDT